MMIRRLFLASTLAVGLSVPAFAQERTPNNNGTQFPPQPTETKNAPGYLNIDKDKADNAEVSDEDQEPFYFPQAHQFERPMYVGADQLQHYRGYWQPGGYDQRAGSPFFFTVPNGPARGPLAGNGPTGAGGMGGGYYGGSGYGYDGYGMMGGYGYDSAYGGSAYGGGYGSAYGGGGAGGAGGDPYGYHFGPGYYRSGEYGHFRFPYYSYRRPWYHPGFAGYNRDTNLPW
ncbi:MAG: hypothetical protein KDA78_00800 [Planctomycetaceae bacterium]|nr:hypothetical protein [Planctomycetaceae bacterium]